MSDTQHLVAIENNIVVSKSRVDFELSSVPQAIINKLELNKSKEILIDCEKETFWTAADLLDAITTIAVKLIEIGVKKGDVFAFFCKNSDLHTIALLAVTAVGAVYTGNLPNSPLREMQNTVTKSAAQYVVLSKADLDKSHEMQEMLSVKLLFILDESDTEKSFISIPSLLEHKECIEQKKHLFLERLSKLDANDLMQIGFSSGTTGAPKAVSRTHANNIAALSLSASGFILVTENDVVGVNSAFCHISGVAMLINALCKGAQAAIMHFDDADKYMFCLQKFSVTVTFTVPSTVNILNKLWTKDTNLVLQKVLVAGEALSEDIACEFVKKFKPVYFSQSFGSTEMGFVTMKPFSEGFQNLNSNGIPVSETQLKICDFESRICMSYFQIGEICVKGVQVSNGYLNNEKANKESYDEYGYFKTGDAGYIDEKGNLFFSSRYKEIIMYDAYQISPTELEFLLIEHEAVKEVAVIGILNEEFGELPKAFVVLNEDFEGKVTEQQLIEYVSQNVSDYKKLRGGIQFLKKFKRTTIGKIDRKALKLGN